MHGRYGRADATAAGMTTVHFSGVVIAGVWKREKFSSLSLVWPLECPHLGVVRASIKSSIKDLPHGVQKRVAKTDDFNWTNWERFVTPNVLHKCQSCWENGLPANPPRWANFRADLISKSCSIIHSYAAGSTQLSRRLPALSSSHTLSFLLAHLGGWHNTNHAKLLSKHCKIKADWCFTFINTVKI